eukprot:scaffold130_cov151-Amphora_coffeaeformis.AAC.2
MATTHFNNRRDFWANTIPSQFEGAPFRLGMYMARDRYEAIMKTLMYTDKQSPAYQDKFWEIREIVAAWNAHVGSTFKPSWVSCLDESMSKWLNKYSCPGFIVCPRKPWPFGNEWHSICCGESQIMWQIELVEGKDRPPEMAPPEHADQGKTVGLLLRLTEPIWHSSRVVILDSGFCVLKGIIALRQKGVFASALIKKRRYWPAYVPGDDIDRHFDDKEVGYVDALQGYLEDRPFHVFAMKEPDYVMKLMSTYGTNERVGKVRMRLTPEKIEFKYPEVVYNHYQYRDAVDSHNSSRMYPIALEETWKTNRWESRVFAFLLAITEVNCRLAHTNIYGADPISQQDFRRQFAKALIYNPYQTSQEGYPRVSPRKGPPEAAAACHRRESLPPYRTWNGGKMVHCRTQYIQLKCSGCHSKTRQYCPCYPGSTIPPLYPAPFFVYCAKAEGVRSWMLCLEDKSNTKSMRNT